MTKANLKQFHTFKSTVNRIQAEFTLVELRTAIFVIPCRIMNDIVVLNFTCWFMLCLNLGYLSLMSGSAALYTDLNYYLV